MDLENKPYKLITDIIVDAPVEKIIKNYGIKNTTVICLNYISNGTSKDRWLYKVKEFLQQIENQSKKECPELWI